MAGAISKITKVSLANFSKAFPQAPSVYSRLNVSKLGFISASNYSQLQGGSGDTTIDADDELGALTQKSKENMEVLMEKTQEKGQEMKEKTKEEANDMKETAKEAAGSMTDKAKEAAGTARDKAEETAEKLKEKAGMGVADDDKTGET
ncbi:hypothetical protein POM88_031529 [Heracleum sosnowskyi]|uniref:Uncharacterized protein n=1 Tax=Heracleum sosnowskyi TaxID=360622 RepID=A0AAD8HXY4_9APIA|nr:hypothetical protein POM88_031529 [Heracleum sosnowskyi]